MIKQKSEEAVSAIVIENIINDLVEQKVKVITTGDILKILNRASAAEAGEEVVCQIARELENHEALLAEKPGEIYVNAGEFFNGKEFLIVPDALEIENNILIPGHRFVPFMNKALFPSEVTLKEAGAKKPQSSRTFTGSAEDIIHYHLLMGAETLFDFFAAEADENIAQARSSANPTLKLAVLDMKKFYSETQFSEGDAIAVKVVDYQNGAFEFHLENGRSRNQTKCSQYREAMEKSLAEVTENLLPGAPIIEQIACALVNAPKLLKNPMMSLDEILLADPVFDIAIDQDISTLVKRTEDDDAMCSCDHDHEHCDCGHDHSHEHAHCDCGHDHRRDLPENETIGSGETGSLEEMLAKLYPMLNLVELDAVLLDNFKNHDLDFNSFYARAFGETDLKFVDGMQEACFFNALEERFEEMLENYPREYDKETAGLRSMIVEFTMERCSLLAGLAELADELTIQPELFENLAEVVILLDESLKLVNAPAALGEEFDFEEFRRGVEDALEKGEEALTALRGVLDGND